MSAPTASLPVALFIGITILAAIGSLFAVARTARRQARERERTRAEAFQQQLNAFLAGGVSDRGLRAAAKAIAPDAFWATFEISAVRLRRDARRALAAALERTRHLSAELRALRDDSSWRRELAARRVGLLPTTASRRALKRAMARGPENVTLAATRALASSRDAAALRWILAHPEALRRRNHMVWTGLLASFGRGGATVLAEALDAGPRDPALERALIAALGRLAHRPSAAAIAARLAYEDAETRVTAARALGALGAAEVIPALSATLDDDAWPVRAQVARALGRLGASAAVAPLASCLEDRAYWVRRHAAYALAALGVDGRAALSRAAASSTDPYAREVAAEALAVGLMPAARRDA